MPSLSSVPERETFAPWSFRVLCTVNKCSDRNKFYYSLRADNSLCNTLQRPSLSFDPDASNIYQKVLTMQKHENIHFLT